MKKLLSIILSIVLCMSLTVTAFAQNTGETSTFAIEGNEYEMYTNENVNIVTDINTGEKSIYDKVTNTLTVYSSESEEPTIISLPNAKSRVSNATKDNEYAYKTSNKRYNGTYYIFWQIQIPDEIKYTYETNSNLSNLLNFQDAVDTIQEVEDILAMSFGTATLNTIITIASTVSSGLLAGVIAAVLGDIIGLDGVSDVVENVIILQDAKDDAEAYFNEVVPVSVP